MPLPLPLLTLLLILIQLRLGELHVEADDQGTSDVDVVDVGQTFSFLPQPSARLGDLVSHDMDLK